MAFSWSEYRRQQQQQQQQQQQEEHGLLMAQAAAALHQCCEALRQRGLPEELLVELLDLQREWYAGEERYVLAPE